MNDRQRYIETLRFGRPDRIPFDPGWGRRSTLAAWHQQGLPPEITDYHAHVRELLHLPAPDRSDTPWPGVDFRMRPQFEEKVLEHRPPRDGAPHGSLIVQDWKGNICEISDEFDVRYLRDPIDFVTRSWIRCPVENRADWESMKARYDASDPGRFPADFSQRAEILRRRTRVSAIGINGPFWQLREWLGFENLCMLLVDEPAFAQEMIDFWSDFVSAMLERMLRDYVPDSVMISEDMAYKEKPMISPEMSRRFLLPSWQRWGEQLRSAGVPVYEVDSDGHVGQLLPVFIEGGFNCNSPLEVAAGNDLPAYRRQYGTAISYKGGVDKRAMARGGKALADEMNRLAPAIRSGGIIPSCDHGVPADVPWPNYVDYCRRLAQVTGWL